MSIADRSRIDFPQALQSFRPPTHSEKWDLFFCACIFLKKAQKGVLINLVFLSGLAGCVCVCVRFCRAIVSRSPAEMSLKGCELLESALWRLRYACKATRFGENVGKRHWESSALPSAWALFECKLRSEGNPENHSKAYDKNAAAAAVEWVVLLESGLRLRQIIN